MHPNTFNQKEYFRPLNSYGFLIVSIEWFIAAVALYIGTLSFWYWPLCMVLLARTQWVLVDNVGHYATHRTLFRTRKLNAALSFLYFLPVFVTFKEWHTDHKTHHQLLGQAEDPEDQTFHRWGLYRMNFWTCLILVPISDLKRNLQYMKVWRDLSLCAFWVIILAAVAFSGTWQILLLWTISFFISRPYLMFLSEVAEHWKTEKNHERWMRGSRVFIRWFMFLKPYGDHLHWMHHEFPGIPGYLLKRAYIDFKHRGGSVREFDNINQILKEIA